MVSQNHTSTTKEKETEKAKEKVLKLMGFPHFTMLLGNDRAVVLEIISSTAKSSLIPRVMDTNIMVYPIRTIFSADMSMLESHSERHRIYNSQHVIHAEAAARPGSTARAGPRSRDSPLYLAVLRNDLDLVKGMLCKHDSKNNALFNIKEGNSIVRASITNMNQEMLDTILKAQPDLVNSIDEEGLNPLSYAAYNGFSGIVRYILKNFPNTRSIRNKDKSCPIHKACLGGHVEVLQAFYSQCPKLFLSDVHQGRTVLHLAAKERGNKLEHVVSYLLSLKEGGELINKKDENGCKPLDLATKYNNLKVERLIKSSMQQ